MASLVMQNDELARKNLIAVGLRAALFLREFCRDNGVPGLGDFLNGMIAAGTHMAVGAKGGSFADALEAAGKDVSAVHSSELFNEVAGKLAGHVLAEVVAEKSTRSLTACAAAEVKFEELGQKLDLTQDEVVSALAYAVTGIIVDATTPETFGDAMTVAIQSARDRWEAAEWIASSSDDDLFDDFE